MTLFKSRTHQEVWIDHHCHRCFQPDEAARRLHGKDTQCPILKRALSSDRKPVQWDRNQRSKDMVTSFKCNAFLKRPALVARPKVNEFEVDQESLWEDSELDHAEHFVPVPGWPERPRSKGVDHA